MKKNDIIEITERSVEERTASFTEMLQHIDTLDDKKRALWLEIYQNAMSDRHNSFLMFKKLVELCESKSTELAVHGKTISSYMERMSKATDQLLKLADLIDRADQSGGTNLNPDDIYSKIRG